MEKTIRFETPENVTVSYRLAGPGTRFVAYLFDEIILTAGTIVLVFVTILSILLILPLSDSATGPGKYVAIAVGLLIILAGFAHLAYFAAFEALRNGQTPGKEIIRARVVMERGFSLTFTAVLIRSIFRLVDTIPLFWAVPFATPKYQRLGDLVAGTVVISEQPSQRGRLRETLATREPSEAVYRFSPADVAGLHEVDVHALELFLERRGHMQSSHRTQVAERLTEWFTNRFRIEPGPPETEREQFLEDLLAARARREVAELA